MLNSSSGWAMLSTGVQWPTGINQWKKLYVLSKLKAIPNLAAVQAILWPPCYISSLFLWFLPHSLLGPKNKYLWQTCFFTFMSSLTIWTLCHCRYQNYFTYHQLLSKSAVSKNISHQIWILANLSNICILIFLRLTFKRSRSYPSEISEPRWSLPCSLEGERSSQQHATVCPGLQLPNRWKGSTDMNINLVNYQDWFVTSHDLNAGQQILKST